MHKLITRNTAPDGLGKKDVKGKKGEAAQNSKCLGRGAFTGNIRHQRAKRGRAKNQSIRKEEVKNLSAKRREYGKRDTFNSAV